MRATKPFIFTLLALILITFITYINILPNQLFFDDEELIYKNIYVQNLSNLPKYFTENMIAGAGKASNMYRPILLTSFAFDFAIWGNNPFGYHLTSILLHAVNSILIYVFIFKLFKKKTVAFLTAVLFIVHPVNSEAVIYASGRTDPLYTFFALSSLVAFVSQLESKSYLWTKYTLSVVMFTLSLTSKESAIIVPLLLLLVAFICLKTDLKILFEKYLYFTPFFIVSFVYIYLRLTAFNFANTLNFYSDSNIYSQNLLLRLYTFSWSFWQYIKIFLFPAELIFARSPKIIINFLNIWTLLFLATILPLLIFSIKKIKQNNIYFFSLLWLIITLLPVSGIIPLNSIIAEHYLYLPSIGLFLLVSFIFSLLWNKYSSPTIRVSLCLVLFLAVSILLSKTIMRTFDFRDAITFYSKSLAQSPWHVPMRNNLAMTYAEMAKYDLAIVNYQKAIEQDDSYPNTHHNLANTYKTIGKYKQAEEEYYQALKIDPSFYFSYFGLADLYEKMGEKEKLDKVKRKIKMP